MLRNMSGEDLITPVQFIANHLTPLETDRYKPFIDYDGGLKNIIKQIILHLVVTGLEDGWGMRVGEKKGRKFAVLEEKLGEGERRESWRRSNFIFYRIRSGKLHKFCTQGKIQKDAQSN